jgi:putative endonuclease
MFFCYIIYSQNLDRFYIGYTHETINTRIDNHNSAKFENSYTSNSNDWKLFFSVECSSQKQALNIEKHIKRMKSRHYMQNLTIYPEISEKLLKKYLI